MRRYALHQDVMPRLSTNGMRMPRRSPGFTLIEVLVAIIILLFGVIVALRIFPRGFAAFTESQQTATSMKIADGVASGFKQHPETAPDGIFPIDIDWGASGAMAPLVSFDDLEAVEYRASAGNAAFDWLNAHLYPVVMRNPDGTVPRAADGSLLVSPRWPLWQPLSARLFRRLEGEKVSIPSGRSADVVEEVLATLTADADQGTTLLTVNDLSKLEHGMWLAVDDPPGGASKIDLLVQLSYSAVNKIGMPVAANPNVRGALSVKLNSGAVLRQFAPASFVPKYLPRFGPIIPNGTLTYDAGLTKFKYVWQTDPGTNLPAPVTLYDLRYRKVSRDELEIKRDSINALPDTFYYTLGRGPSIRDAGLNDKIVLLPADVERYVRFSFTVQEGAVSTFISPKSMLLPVALVPNTPVSKTLLILKQADGDLYPINAIANDNECRIEISDQPALNAASEINTNGTSAPFFISGSEQINRAYRLFGDTANVEAIQPDEDPTCVKFYDAANPRPQDERLRTYYTKLGAMPSGFYYFPRMDHDAVADSALPGTIYFSSADRGRTVKLDYTVADWSVLHEEMALNNQGYATLALADLKVTNRPSEPREPKTWGLYGPMQDDGHDAVIGLVDTRTDMVYHVIARPSDRVHPFGLEPSSGVAVPNQAIAVDLSQAASGRLRLGGVPDDVTWLGLWQLGAAGYKVGDGVQHNGLPYQCTADHAPGVANEPGIGATWQTCWQVIDHPDWTKLAGSNYRIYYRARRDWTVQVFKAPAVFWNYGQQSGVTKTNLASFTLDWRASAWIIDTVTDPVDPTKTVSVGWLAVPGIYAGQSVAVDYYRQSTDGDGASTLTRVSGEVHTVPAREKGRANSLIRLGFSPAPNTSVTVRGVSITVRALWVQPRSGQVAVYEGSPTAPTAKMINERWAARGVTFTLPTTK